jgi:hypothetical protein
MWARADPYEIHQSCLGQVPRVHILERHKTYGTFKWVHVWVNLEEALFLPILLHYRSPCRAFASMIETLTQHFLSLQSVVSSESRMKKQHVEKVNVAPTPLSSTKAPHRGGWDEASSGWCLTFEAEIFIFPLSPNVCRFWLLHQLWPFVLLKKLKLWKNQI